MTLYFIPPTLEDSKTFVSPPPEVEEEGVRKWEKCLVGYFLDSNLPQAVVRSITMKLWRKHNLMDVISLEDGFYMFKFLQLYSAKEF